jgi:hypothetical protein
MSLTFRRDGWVVRWAYLLEDWPPSRTTLCELFWRCVLLSPWKVLAVAFIGTVIVFGGPIAVTALCSFFLGTEVALLIVAPTALLLTLNILDDDARERLLQQTQRSRVASTVRNVAEVGDVISGGVMALKSRFCPIVRIEDE